MAFPDERFIAHVDSTLLHDLHWPIVGLLARHHVEHLELRHYLDDLPARGEWLFARAVPRPTERSRADDPPTEFDIYGAPPSSPGEARHIHVRRPSRSAASRAKPIPQNALDSPDRRHC